MVYGRLDVFGPDGSIKSFPLSSQNVSVGRSSGNTVMLDNSTISRYHFTITREKNEVYITDLESANGTHVDGVKLVSNDRRVLGGGEEIQIGNLRIIFHRLDDAPTQPTAAQIDMTQRIEAPEAAFVVDLHRPEQSVAPGAHISAELAITNNADTERRYVIEVGGLPREWVRVDRPNPLVGAKDSTFILINFKPLRRSESKPGNYNVTIRVSPQDKSDSVVETTLTLSVLTYGGFGMALQSSRVSSGEPFQLYLHNQGSGQLPLAVYGRDLTGRLDFNIPSPKVVLAPGQQMTVQGEIKPKKATLVGKSRLLAFDIVARSNDNASFTVPVRGYFVDKPLLPAWAPLLLAGLMGVLGVIVLAVIGIILLRPSPEPTFTDFQISTTQIARGEPLQIQWQAADVIEYRLSMNGTPVRSASDPGATAFADVDTTNFSGEVIVRLEGINGDLEATQEAVVRIYEPIQSTEVDFEVTPSQLVRYVAQALNIRWNVPGAVLARVTGLEAFNSLPVEVAGPEGVIDVAGIPRDPLTLRLVAQDEAGNIYEETRTINVINPECSAAAGDVTIYAGPDTSHQVIGTIFAGTSVVVNAQDVSGRWLRVLLPGEQNGWAELGRLTCQNTFNVADLFKESNVPPLPPTVTSIPVPTVTAAPQVTNTPVPTPTPPAANG